MGRKVSEGIDGDGGDDGGGNDGDGDRPGCTDPAAFNYDPTASYDDGSCILCDTEFTQGPDDVSGLDPIFLLPHLYGERDEVQQTVLGSTGKTVGTTSATNGGCNGDLHDCPPEVLFNDINSSGPETFEWWDGNYFNVFNTRGPNNDFTVGALNGAASPYVDAPHSNEADSAATYFRMQADSIIPEQTAAQRAIIDRSVWVSEPCCRGSINVCLGYTSTGEL